MLSDVILYNDNGVPSTDLSVLKKYLEDITETVDLSIKSSFIKYVTIGGYNVTWNARKPVFNAIGKGSVLLIHSDAGMDAGRLMNNHFIGERTYEGYGEICVEEARSTAEEYILKEQIPEHTYENNDNDMSGIINALLVSELDKKIYEYIVDNVIVPLRKQYKKGSATGLNTALAKLRLIFKDVTTYEEMLEQISELVMINKKNICMELCKKVVPKDIMSDKLRELNEMYHMDIIADYDDKQMYKKIYGIYISELKYLVKILAQEEKDNE